MKVTIDTDTITQFIETLSDNSDEWWGPENDMTFSCIIDYFEWSGQTEIVQELTKARNRIAEARAERRREWRLLK